MSQDNEVTYKVKIKNIERAKNHNKVVERVAMIVREINVNGNVIEIPSPLSIYAIDMADRLNTQRAYANVFCGFLNYIQKQVNDGNSKFDKVKLKGIYALTWEHACSYLKYCKNELHNSRDTVKYKMRFIKNLYKYLIEEGVLDKSVEIKMVSKYNYKLKRYTTSIANPFTKSSKYRVRLPDEVTEYSKEKLKDLDERLWLKLLSMCDDICPEIKLGVYMQIMGGLRMGEVVNLTINSLNINKVYDNELEKELTEITVDIRNRNNELFDRDVRLDSCQTKKARYNQIILDPLFMLGELYEKHISEINKIKDKTKSKYKNALFVNSKGQPMTGSNYSDRFYKLKKAFLEYLEQYSYADFNLLKNQKKWGTHIGRGIYTNFIIHNDLATLPNGEVSSRLLADLRGDSSEDSARDYIEKGTIIKNIRGKQKILYKKLKKIERGLEVYNEYSPDI